MKPEDRIVTLLDGTEVYIKDPTRKDREGSESAKAKAWHRALDDGCKTEEQMLRIIAEKGLWDDDRETQIAELQEERESLEKTIKEGGIKLSEAKANAIKIIKIDNIVAELASNRIKYLGETLEAHARRAEYDYLVSCCAVYNSNRGKPYFKNYEDYLNKKSTYDVNLIASKASEVLYGMPDLDNTPAKQFLKEFKFVDDQLRLINKDGHLVDEDGRLVDEHGNYIKYVGRGDKKRPVIVDIDGNEIKEQKRKAFLDDDGKPIKKVTSVKSKTIEEAVSEA